MAIKYKGSTAGSEIVARQQQDFGISSWSNARVMIDESNK